jgi:hypothetical protein
MSVSSAAARRPAPSATASRLSVSRSAASSEAPKRAEPDLDVHHERVEPGRQLLRQDRRGDQRIDSTVAVTSRIA